MKKAIMIIVTSTLFSWAVSAVAMEIAWMYVQHRQYGDTGDVNRLGFGLVDDELRYLRGDDRIARVSLYGPDGEPVKLAPHQFGEVEEVYGRYDSKNSRWHYSAGWEYDSWFSADILAPLAPGQYRLQVSTTDGKTAERTYAIIRPIRLPVVAVDTFAIRSDAGGNLIWTWAIPEELGRLSQSEKTRARASIDIYNGDDIKAYFSIILPSHMGYNFIPAGVVDQINTKGNRFEMKISLETRDKNNRSYSKPLVFHENLPRIP
jgi:hypothetical protein